MLLLRNSCINVLMLRTVKDHSLFFGRGNSLYSDTAAQHG
jgi:hypothetical protein